MELNRILKKLLLLLFIYTLTGLFVVGLFALSTIISKADAVELEEVSIQYKRFNDGSYAPLINTNGLDDRTLESELNLRVNVDMVDGIFFFNNLVHSQTDKFKSTGVHGQFRLVGWNYQLGMRVTPSFHIVFDHYSKHLLDTQYQFGTYPREDSIGFIIYLQGGPKGKGLIP